ncbi:serpin B3-like [Erinaceus europaeus]|uniref:Serpin B3-like n=1 Tax=Erinaceus europaeus TaxID=9365 RepID=A0A1S2ZT89_ERIEU|nr:serpin B3-like [Erinaceus europaeus]
MSSLECHFAVKLFQQIRLSNKENIFFSPFSILSALSLVYLGAKKNTAVELQKVLFSDESSETTNEGNTAITAGKLDKVHHHFQKLQTELNKPSDDYELSTVNRLYGEKTFRFLQEYTDNIKKFYLADVESVDFANAAEECRKMINSWVERQTHDKIKDLIPKGDLTGAILLLVNAVYFKGQWENIFDEKITEQAQFWLNKDTSKSVEMMRQISFYNFSSLEDVQAKILEIPYKGKDLSMVVLLPNEVDGLKKLEENFTSNKLKEWMRPENMSARQVSLHLPRLHVEESYDLKATLMGLGIVDAFSSQDADLSGMTGSQGLVLSKVLHKCLVDVTERGTEAAAATAIKVEITASPYLERFHCDHPFLFFIKHNKFNSILFFGRFSSP